MESFLFYIGKVAIAAGAFYLAYLVLFQNQKHFGFNRVYLPVSMFLSFLIPLITFTSIQYVEPLQIDYSNITYIDNFPAGAVAETGFALMWYHYLFGMYILGITGFLFHLLLGHLKAIHIVRKSRIQKLFESIVNVTKKDVHPFSFFNKIVLSEKSLDNKNLEMIVSHEKIHVDEKHTLDILFTEIMFLFQWFNPFAWLLKDAIKNNLEYKTDHQVTQRFNTQEYQMAMVGLADKEGVAPFLTALNGSQLKNRIIMMKKKSKNRYGLLKQLVVLPLLAVLVMGLSSKEVKTEFLPEPVNNGSTTKNIVVVVDGKMFPSDSEKLKTLDVAKGFRGDEIMVALGLDVNKVVANGMKVNEDPDDMIYYIRTTDYVEGSNAEFDKFFENTVIKNALDKQVKNPTKTVYAIDGELKTDEEIKHLDNYNFESAAVLSGKTATDKYGEDVNDASVVDLKTGEPRITLSFPDETTISGKVADENDKPISAVTVVIKGKTAGTVTNSNGNFQIKTDENSTLVFTAPGYNKQEIKTEGKTEINLQLHLDAKYNSTDGGSKNKVAPENKYSVSGKVTDINGNPIMASIIMKGKPVGTVTDSDGNYQIGIYNENETLVFVLPGYKSKEMKVKAGEIINVKLTVVKNQKLDSVKVTGYGRLPGNDSQIRIRNTENEDFPPLIVFDGNIVEDINSISPSEIHSMTVLKETSATALYGEKAANGVIIITSNEFGIKSIKDIPGNPMVIVDGKKFKSIEESGVEEEDIESITVLKDAAEKFYGKDAKDGAVILTTAKSNKKNVEEFNAEKFIVRPQDLNKNPQLTIRGEGALFGDNPIVVVDGKVFKSIEEANITPEKISNITVLKDKTATDLYGQDAKNGVVIIETNKE